MWLWPLHRFWTFAPLGWLLAGIWNVCELARVPCPMAPQAFGIIMGVKSQKVQP